MMTSRFFGNSPARPLTIDWDSYTDGDAEFKKELVDLMIDNLQEMQQTLTIILNNNDAPLFQKVCHKIKTTIHMLDDKELSETVEQLKIIITDPTRIASLDRMCAEIIESLRK